MNMLSIKFRAWFYNFMQVQLFLSVISLPILISWGLPFSLMTVCGNLLFTPLLFLFLLCSSFIFFFELLSLPNSLLITVLEKLFAFWMYLLSFGSPKWLYGIDQYGLVLSILGALAACLTLQHKILGKPKNHWPFLCLLLCTPFLYQHVRSYFPQKTSVTCLRKIALVSAHRGIASVIDKGAFGEKQAASTWVQYTFLSEILKKCGATRFDTITTLAPNARTLDALITLCQHASIKTIKIQHPHKKSAEYKKAWKTLQSLAHKEKFLLHVIVTPPPQRITKLSCERDTTDTMCEQSYQDTLL